MPKQVRTGVGSANAPRFNFGAVCCRVYFGGRVALKAVTLRTVAACLAEASWQPLIFGDEMVEPSNLVPLVFN